MSELLNLEKAMAVIGGQRTLLGDSVVDVTLAALRAKREGYGMETAVPLPERPTQRKQLTILFARVSGFTGAAHAIPDTRILNIINLLWRRLDGAITSQGGMVDKHMGDAVMGLFGVPVAAEDDPKRAVRAALAMRKVLHDFIAEIRADFEVQAETVPAAAAVLAALDALSLDVGINTGPVLVGEVGTSDEYTVIGDPVNVASRLQQKAPKGGILIAHETYLLVHGAFDIEPLGPMQVRGKPKPIQVYLVNGEQLRVFSSRGRGVEGVETAMIGRDKELLWLQTSLRDVVQNGRGRVITIIGEAGIGKSRLTHEYERWVDVLPLEVKVLKANTEPSMRRVPYSLMRNLFVTFFDIQDNDPAPVVEAKMMHQMALFFPNDSTDQLARRSHALAQLLGLNLDDDLSLPVAAQTREDTFADVARILRETLADCRAGLMILEDVHWADEGSLDMIDHIAELCRQLPLLVLCVARPGLLDRRTKWGVETAVNGSQRLLDEPLVQHMVNLEMLTVEESQELVENILRHLPEVPPALSDLIVHRSAGNPFYVEELVKVLIEDGVIVTGEKSWRVLQQQLVDVRIPATLTGVLQARLDRLSSLERVTLQRAAVIGRVFWDSPVILMNDAAEQTAVHAPETITALKALEKREMIFQRNSSVFAGSNAYLFKHEMLREVAYESVLLRMRPAYHKQVADWLTHESGERVAEYAGLIADHYEKARQKIPAAQMYEMAGNRARELSNPQLALSHYHKVLALIAQEPHQNMWRVAVFQQVAELLRMQARLVESVQAYHNMCQIAEADGNLSAQAVALVAQSDVLLAQIQYEKAFTAAEKAEKIAWLVGDNSQLARALLYKSQASHRLGSTTQAREAAQQALEWGERLEDSAFIVQCLQALTLMSVEGGRQAHVTHYLNRLQELINKLDKAKVDLLAIGTGFIALGEINNRLGRYDKVARPSLLAVRIFKKLDRQDLAAKALYNLGKSGRLRGDIEQAMPFYREALAIASTIGDRFHEMFYRLELGAAYVGLGRFDLAEKELVGVIRLADNSTRFEQWRGMSMAYHHLARVMLAQGRWMEALAAAQRSVAQASALADERMIGKAWYGLGLVTAALPPQELPITVRDKSYMPDDCFSEGVRYLRQAGGDSTGTFREQALTMRAWAQYEGVQGNERRSEILALEAQALADEIGLTFADMRQ
ncbi:MAG: AAA family ATPase [Anaerolineae bacterium]|nr:AAA family ATPase [Anaerolineae bacterium]